MLEGKNRKGGAIKGLYGGLMRNSQAFSDNSDADEISSLDGRQAAF